MNTKTSTAISEPLHSFGRQEYNNLSPHDNSAMCLPKKHKLTIQFISTIALNLLFPKQMNSKKKNFHFLICLFVCFSVAQSTG